MKTKFFATVAISLSTFLIGIEPVHAGRPVFHSLSLKDVIAKSKAIVLGRKTADGKLVQPNGCELDQVELQVVETLKPQQGSDPDRIRKLISENAKVKVVTNPAWQTDCAIRKSNPMTKGASFSAELYTSQKASQDWKVGEEALVFLIQKDGVWSLVSNGAIEEKSKKDAVMAELGR